jgi:ABC-type lipoprotein export system ATPase subunit
MGFIFQGFELLDYLSVEHNILLPYYLNRGVGLTQSVKDRLGLFLDRVGLKGKSRSYPEALSHGEKQRVAVLRALITLPKVVIGDEPTANLDRENAQGIMELILQMVKENKATFILVSHDPSFADRFDKKLELGKQ